MNKEDSQCKEQKKWIHLLKLEKQELERDMGIMENHAEEQIKKLQNCEEEFHTQKEKLKESRQLCC